MSKIPKYCVYLLVVFFFVFSDLLFAQNKKITLTDAQIEQIKKNEQIMKEWLDKLTSPGVELKGDKMNFSPEVLKMMKNQEYRDEIYKGTYTFGDVGECLSKMEIQKAFWQMLNLYPDNKEQVIQYIYAYNSVIDASRILFSAFYTYAFFDPEISMIENEKLNINRPDLLENHHKNMLEIISYIDYLEKEKNNTRSKP